MSSSKYKRKLAEFSNKSSLESEYSDASGESESNIENDESENKSASDDEYYTDEENEDKKPLISLNKYPNIQNPKIGKVTIHKRKRNGKLAQKVQKLVKRKLRTKQVRQTKHIIQGIEVIFPGQPYPTQKKMMQSVIEGLKGGNNNLIESPTGTGKTLAMLCAILAWRRASPKFRRKFSKIYYTTRTHSQLSGIMKELKKTVYSKDIKTTILGSRNITCINPTRPVAGKNGKVSVDSYCQKLRDNYKKLNTVKAAPKKKAKPIKLKTCSFYHGTKTGALGGAVCGSELMDIEDYKRVGKAHQVCPYYTTMHLHAEADLILCPYNYIISRQLRKNCQIELEDSVIIFDEGHNLEKACCDEASTSITATQAQKIAQSCLKALKKIAEDDLPAEEVDKPLKLFAKIFNNLASLIKEQQQFQEFMHPGAGATIENSEVLKLLAKIGLASNHLTILKEKSKSIMQILDSYKKKYLDSDLVEK